MFDIVKVEIYYKLIHLIRKYGKSSAKKHGEYITFRVFEDYDLVLDTWNNAVVWYDKARNSHSLGIDWGGFNCDLAMVQYWITIIEIKYANNGG